MRIGAIEAGGTKIVCGIGDETGHISKQISFPTRSPEITVPEVIDFFADEELDGLGIASFGPIVVDSKSKDYGRITSTPKLEWQNFDWSGTLSEKIIAPIYIDTDVNAAVLGEIRWGSAQGLDNCVYITVGTGIGAGVLVEGNLVHGLLHPEVGHMFVKRHPKDEFNGTCPYHGDCLEGLACGPAISSRWGYQGKQLTGNDSVWELESYYLAQAITNLTLILSTKRIILGGGVMSQPLLLPLIRKKTLQLLNGYIGKTELMENIDQYIVPPMLGGFSGLKGAIALVLSAT